MRIEDFLRERLDESMEHFKTLTKESLPLIAFSNIVANMKYAIDWHDNFPIMIETKPELDFSAGVDDVNQITVAMSKEIEWLTMEEYRKKFGSEPPTSDLIQAWAQAYAWHPDFKEEWLLS